MTGKGIRIVLVDPTRLDDDVLLALFRDVSSPDQLGRVEVYPVLLVGNGMRYAFMLIVAPEEELERGFITRIGRHHYAFVEAGKGRHMAYMKHEAKAFSAINVYYADDKETLREILRSEGVEK
jgi:hypothetical protein